MLSVGMKNANGLGRFATVPTKLNLARLRASSSPVDYLEYPIQTLKVGSLGTHNALGLARENARTVRDQITVEQDTRTFVALGATGAQSLVPFESQTLSAIEAIAQVGGLATSLADPTGVFVFRNEPAEIANAVLGRNDLQGDQRMIYVLDLTQPTGMFEARDFLVRDGDTVYVTEAPFVQWTKTLSAITGTSGAANSLATTASGG